MYENIPATTHTLDECMMRKKTHTNKLMQFIHHIYPFDQHNIRQHEALNLDMTMKQFDRCLANRHPMSVEFDVLDKHTHTRAHR